MIRKLREVFNMGDTYENSDLFTIAADPMEKTADIPEIEGKIDKYSETWQHIDAWLDAQISRLRIKNDNPTYSEINTAVLRGQIKMLKALKKLPDGDKGILNR